jgi:hypothetical protein
MTLATMRGIPSFRSLGRRVPRGFLSLALLAAACGGTTEPYQGPAGTPLPEVRIEPAEVSLAVGQRLQLHALGPAVYGVSSVQWISTDPAVATVAADGMLEGVGDGLTMVIALAGTARGVADVGVRGNPGGNRPGRPPFK